MCGDMIAYGAAERKPRTRGSSNFFGVAGIRRARPGLPEGVSEKLLPSRAREEAVVPHRREPLPYPPEVDGSDGWSTSHRPSQTQAVGPR